MVLESVRARGQCHLGILRIAPTVRFFGRDVDGAGLQQVVSWLDK